MAKAKKAAGIDSADQNDEVVDLKKAARKDKKAAKKAALLEILAYCKENDILAESVKLLTPGNRGGGAQMSSSKMAIIEKIKADKICSEDEIWNEFKLGRAEMRKIIVNLIKKVSKPEDRVWVSFSPEEGIYTLISTGADAPKDWNGYRPVDTEDIDLD